MKALTLLSIIPQVAPMSPKRWHRCTPQIQFCSIPIKACVGRFWRDNNIWVEKILNHREEPGDGVEYHVQWKGYKERTWEPQENFIERKSITDYWKNCDQPSAHSLMQPHQMSANHMMMLDKQELSSMQQRVSEQNKSKPLNNTSSDAQKGQACKHVALSATKKRAHEAVLIKCK